MKKYTLNTDILLGYIPRSFLSKEEPKDKIYFSDHVCGVLLDNNLSILRNDNLVEICSEDEFNNLPENLRLFSSAGTNNLKLKILITEDTEDLLSIFRLYSIVVF